MRSPFSKSNLTASVRYASFATRSVQCFRRPRSQGSRAVHRLRRGEGVPRVRLMRAKFGYTSAFVLRTKKDAAKGLRERGWQVARDSHKSRRIAFGARRTHGTLDTSPTSAPRLPERKHLSRAVPRSCRDRGLPFARGLRSAFCQRRPLARPRSRALSAVVHARPRGDGTNRLLRARLRPRLEVSAWAAARSPSHRASSPRLRRALTPAESQTSALGPSTRTIASLTLQLCDVRQAQDGPVQEGLRALGALQRASDPRPHRR